MEKVLVFDFFLIVAIICVGEFYDEKKVYIHRLVCFFSSFYNF